MLMMWRFYKTQNYGEKHLHYVKKKNSYVLHKQHDL